VTAPVTSPALVLRDARVWAVRDGLAGGDEPGRVTILDGVSWTVAAGSHWALLGANGAGKSTLLQLAGGVRQPSSGVVEILGNRVGRVDLRALRAGIGVVDARLAGSLPGWLPVEDVVLTGATGTVQPDWPRYGDKERARAAELLALVGCAHLTGRPLGRCSTGERQRVQLARALMPAPALLLLDEPAAGLSAAEMDELAELIRGMRGGPAVVLVEHHMDLVMNVCDQVVVLDFGKVIAAGAPAEVRDDPAVLDAYLGEEVAGA
jgi:branched-chain amino acid transport system ATP-binding protein